MGLGTVKLMPRGKRILAAILVLAAAGGHGGNQHPSLRETPVRGGTATYALSPTTVPDYIFPFLSTPFSVANINYFTQLMYRPLYWFGSSGRPVLNRPLSLAHPPTFHGRDVTIRLSTTGGPTTSR